MFPAIKAGAAGYLLKDVRPAELADAVRKASRGEALLAPSVAARLMQEVAGERPARHRADRRASSRCCA